MYPPETLIVTTPIMVHTSISLPQYSAWFWFPGAVLISLLSPAHAATTSFEAVVPARESTVYVAKNAEQVIGQKMMTGDANTAPLRHLPALWFIPEKPARIQVVVENDASTLSAGEKIIKVPAQGKPLSRRKQQKRLSRKTESIKDAASRYRGLPPRNGKSKAPIEAREVRSAEVSQHQTPEKASASQTTTETSTNGRGQ